MTTVLKVNINDINSQFFIDLSEKIAASTEIEIRIPHKKHTKELFADEQFWQIIHAFDWSKTDAEEIMAPAVDQLAAMPIVNIYLFADKLSEKLFLLDTRTHGDAYLANEGDDYLSVDDFLYIRCAVVAEGKEYFEHVAANPSEFPDEISFEPLLSLAHRAYEKKTGRKFEYYPAISYETYSNKEAWK
ncbi:MAG: DUF4240 domain-containing protein [Saprospiraceae bacterium]|jgi:hypothetical protein|nr:DUF4240 domain-containing protein [Saprospiraceae bacterium]